MEREMCGYLEWNLNVTGQEVLEFEARIRAEHGPKAVARPSSSGSSEDVMRNSYPTPDTTPDPMSRPIRPVPSPYKSKTSYQPRSASTLPSPPDSPAPHFASSNSSSLQSSPASDDCKTPSPVAVTAATASRHGKQMAFAPRHRAVVSSGYEVPVASW